MSDLNRIPELVALDARESLIRIPGQQDVPVTPRIRGLVDSRPFRRLANIRQLGLVSLVFPGATHSRFEHSLGVYRMALLFLKRLQTIPEFSNQIDQHNATRFLVASLLHDVGHWPYCHPFEDMGLPNVPDHEELAERRLNDSGVPKILKSEFDIELAEVTSLLFGKSSDSTDRILQSLLSGPIDVDKMDYLYRDSLHSGVPYGMHYDQGRLIGSLCLNESANSLAITRKGTTAAELMVFARYVMFSEVYWHHTVRSATAMLQRAFFHLQPELNLPQAFDSDDETFRQMMLGIAELGSIVPTVATMIHGLFGERRSLYKRLVQFSVLESPALFRAISHRPYADLVSLSDQLAETITRKASVELRSGEVLIDAPPVGLEVQFQIPVRTETGYRQLGELSPVVRALAEDQFDNFVKRVRVFVTPQHADSLKRKPIADWLEELVAQV